MIELTKYFPKQILELCWELESQLVVERGDNSTIHDVRVSPRGPLAHTLLTSTGLPESDLAPNALAYKSLGLMMKQGPVIVRPNPLLCEALHDTEIRVSTTEFTMPYSVIGVELPPTIVGRHHPSLTVLWRMFPDSLMIWTLSLATGVMYHTLVGDDLPTIEDRLVKAEGCDDDEEYNLVVVGGRIAANLCMLASHRKIAVDEFPAKVRRHREGRDARLKLLAARHCREVVFRDLILKDRPSYVQRPSFVRGPSPTQHRRGHWRRVVHGPKHSLRRWQWISDYQTGTGDDHPTIIMK